MPRISILVYTHSEYSFMWKPMCKLLQKYVTNIDIHWLYDEGANNELLNIHVPIKWYRHTYNENMIWTKRVLKALNEINDDYVLFLHEDWLPINEVKLDVLNKMITFMETQNCGFLVSYAHFSTTYIQEGIFTGFKDYYYYSENNHIFQPAIWNKNIFIEFCSVLNKSKHQNEDRECLDFMKQKNCWSVQNRETSTTFRTTNSLMFPHMHALSEGLWNFTKYPQLKSFLESFGVDTSTRGTHTWWELDTQ